MRGLCIGLFLCLATSAHADTVSFRQEVMPILARAGCNQGACHGNLNGKGGFKLSLRGEDPAADFATLLDRFYAAATHTLLRRDAVVDKLIGDEVMAFFVRGISGPDYRHQAVRAGLELLSAIGYGRDGGPWLNVGAAVNAGPAYVGNVGGAVVDFTALGDSVNAAARMQQAAAGGELLVAAGVADDLVAHGSRRQPALRGPRPADRSLRVDHPETSEEARWRTTACTASVACTRVSWIRTRPRPAQ